MGRNGLSKIGMAGAVAVFSMASIARAASADFERAREEYQRTDYKTAIDTLLSISPKTAAVYVVTGKAYYMDGQYKKSASCLEKAVIEDPLNSSYYDWLGKAYGGRAEESSFLTALSYANKARGAFERAVALDPSNLEALDDLFEYYIEAPGMVGGGVDKAEGVAAQIGRLSEAEYHYVLARLAQKRKDIRAAEREYRKAVQLAPGDAGRVIDLAGFLAEHGRYGESDEFFRVAAQIEPDSPKLVFARAAAYIQSRRNLQEARTLLLQYAGSRITPDDPPRSEVARLLKNVTVESYRKK
jgi:tetratricopeptide (TPR) repeat protein